ncbi:MAG: TIGR03915 family putative DNA repair protein [Bacteroidales bacterium]|jgi:probable DNA metabolism protein|nr:TIGR03915 family putative DNA repair protein [Bacteroidales bacterium]
MIVFRYDKTFDGLLCVVFEAYNRKIFPEKLLGLNDIEPLFTSEVYIITTQREPATRVWKGLRKKLSVRAFNMIMYAWLSELENTDELLLRLIKKIFDNKDSIETNFADIDLLETQKIALKVSKEKMYLQQFARFQKTADDIYVAPLSPVYNALPLSLAYFKDRFADQKWIVYDTKRQYGFYYDLKSVVEITLDNDLNLPNGQLDESIMSEDEKLFQQLWKSYFKSVTIKERINLKLHRQHMPKRFWKYMPEKQ